jgi:sporulation protein YlmC with PRC-barrel domain
MQQPPPQPLPDDSSAQPTQPLNQPPPQESDTFVGRQVQPPAQPLPQVPDSSYAQQMQFPGQPSPGSPSTQPAQPAPQNISPGRANWVTFSQLRGHPLVDIAEGRAIGTVDDLLFDEQRRVIQAFATKGGILRRSTLVPALKAKIGVDAVTFQPGTLAGQDTSWLDALPKATELVGMRVLSDTGKLLGSVEDLRIDPDNGTLAAFELKPEQTGIPHRLGTERRLLPGNSVISYGPDAIIAHENAISGL